MQRKLNLLGNGVALKKEPKAEASLIQGEERGAPSGAAGEAGSAEAGEAGSAEAGEAGSAEAGEAGSTEAGEAGSTGCGRWMWAVSHCHGTSPAGVPK